jgi:hypothetical protein
MSNERPGGILAWQYRHYPEFHGDRKNLILHILTVPLFQLGTLMLFTGPLWAPWWYSLVGLGLMAGAMITQGRGHAMEKNPPVPFAGPIDVLGRIFGEQWLSFPRYVLSGGFAKAWRGER